jgi:hypothetical protein
MEKEVEKLIVSLWGKCVENIQGDGSKWKPEEEITFKDFINYLKDR